MSKPIFGLTAAPQTKIEIPDLFGGRDRAVVRAFENPPKIRPRAGFGLEHDGSSKIVAGKMRQAGIPNWNRLELWRDGTLIFVADAYDFLCHWNHPPANRALRINPLVICESTYNFVHLSEQVYEEAKPIPTKIEFGVSLSDVVINSQPAELTRGPLVLFPQLHVRKSPEGEASLERKVQWSGSKILRGQIAFSLVSEVYHWFGFNDDEVPYSSTGLDGKPEIDPELIKAAG